MNYDIGISFQDPLSYFFDSNKRSRKSGLKVSVTKVFDSNLVAKSIYSKIGFENADRIPKGVFKKGRYIDLST